MKAVIRENELATTEVWRYDDVLAVRSPDDVSGVEVWHNRRMATFQSQHSPGTVSEHSQLLVVVGDPDDPAVIDRLRTACADASQNNRNT